MIDNDFNENEFNELDIEYYEDYENMSEEKKKDMKICCTFYYRRRIKNDKPSE